MAARTLPTTGDLVRQSIQGRRRSFGDVAFPAALLVALLFSLLFLATLLVDTLVKAWDAFSGRGWSVVTNPLSLNADTAGLWQSIMGSLGLTVVVVVIAFPVGIGAAVWLRSGSGLGPAREVHGGSGYWSQASPVMVMGSETAPTAVEVRWPGGGTTRHDVPADAREIVVTAP